MSVTNNITFADIADIVPLMRIRNLRNHDRLDPINQILVTSVRELTDLLYNH